MDNPQKISNDDSEIRITSLGPVLSPKQKRRIIFAALLICVFLILSSMVTGIFLYLHNLSTPEKTLEAFCSGLVHHDLHSAYEQFSQHQDGIVDESTFSQSIEKIIIQQGKIKDCRVQDVSQRDSTYATGTTILIFQKGYPLQSHWKLIFENGSWKLAGLVP
jgi:hypothetical protein